MLNDVVAIPVFTLWFGAIKIDPIPMDWITVFVIIYWFSVYCKFKTSPKLNDVVSIPLIVFLLKEFKVPVLIPTVSVFPVKSLEISSIIKFLSDVLPGSNLLEKILPWNEEFTCKLSCPIFPYGGSVK